MRKPPGILLDKRDHKGKKLSSRGRKAEGQSQLCKLRHTPDPLWAPGPSWRPEGDHLYDPLYLAELPGGSERLCEGACSANREAPHRTELLLETGCFNVAQGLETTISIWKIESILRLELWFMILCFSCQQWAQPKVPLTARCWGGFPVKILFISQLAVKSQIVLKYSHYPESAAALLPEALSQPSPLKTSVKLSQGPEWF